MLTSNGIITVTRKFSFEAAHHLPLHKGKCRRLHGHTYNMEVEVWRDMDREKRDPSETGMVMDFGDLKEVVNKLIIEKFDHEYLNTSFENPTAEVMLDSIVAILQQAFEAFGARLIRVKLQETENSWAEWKSDLTRGTAARPYPIE